MKKENKKRKAQPGTKNSSTKKKYHPPEPSIKQPSGKDKIKPKAKSPATPQKESAVVPLIEELALSTIMEEQFSREQIAQVLKALARIKELAVQEKLSAISDISDLLVRLLSHPPQKPQLLKQLISDGISFLQNAFHNEGEPINNIKKHFAKLLDEAPKKSAHTPPDASILHPEELPDFISGTEGIIEDLENNILKIEKNLQDKEIFDAIFRGFHTIKGESSLLGIGNLKALTHEMENLLEKIRSEELTLDGDIITVMLNTLDVLKSLIKTLRNDLQKGVAFDVSEAQSLIVETFNKKVDDEQQDTQQQNSQPKDSQQESSKPPKAATDFTPHIPVLNIAENGGILADFLPEAAEHLDEAENSLLILEKSPENMDEINNIFRKFHTIKGVSGFLELKDISILTHESETMMDCIRKGYAPLSHEITEAIFLAIDSCRKLFELLKEQIENKGTLQSPYHNIAPVLTAIKTVLSSIQKPESKKTAPSAVPKLGEILLEQKAVLPGDIEEALTEQVHGDARKIGEILVAKGKLSETQVQESLSLQQQKAIIEETIKVNTIKLDNLIDMVGELVIIESQIYQNIETMEDADSRLLKDIAQLRRIIHNVQNTAMSMRLVPIKPLFQKMIRLIRDLSKKQGKEVEIKITGEETEIDKNIIELLSDPLMHMVRNSIDHGIEVQELRRQKNKNPLGTIELHAFHRSGTVVVEIKDDGKGLDKEKILLKAIERKLISEGTVLPDKRIYNFIFEAGFSTAEKVTDISGRGVGMDVVKRNIEKLRGKIDIDTELDKGSTFSIKLPLTLAIIEGIVVKLGKESYIIPISSVVEFISPKKKDVVTLHGKGEMIKVRNKLFRLIRLSHFFNVESIHNNIEKNTICIMESDYGQAALVLDELLGQQEIVIKSLGERLKNAKGLAGATILGDGKVGLILDVNGIMELARI